MMPRDATTSAWPPVADSGWHWGIVALTLAVQFALQAAFFPLGALGSAAPLLHIDSPFHLYQMEVARQLCTEGRLTGYDPMFAAGQAAGVAENLSGKAQALLACLGGPEQVAFIYKGFTFWAGVISPALLVTACIVLGLPTAATGLAAALSVLLWWTGPLRWYHAAGMVTYVMAAYLVPLFVVLFLRWCRERPGLVHVGLALLAAGGMWLHPLFPVAATLAGLLGLITGLRRGASPLRCLSAVLIVAVPMLCVNWLWIGPYLQGRNDGVPGLPYQADIVPALAWLELLGTAPTAAGGSRLGWALLLGVGLWVLLARHSDVRATWGLSGLAGGALLLMLWASFGALSSFVVGLQPNRFSALAWLCIVPAASMGLVRAGGALRGARDGRRWMLSGALVFAALVLGFFVRELWREVFADPTVGRYATAPPEVKGEGSLSRDIISLLRDQTDSDARVLFETSLARVHDGGHMAGYYALMSGREFIGGAYPGGAFANVWDNHAFGKGLDEHRPEALRTLLDLYNIRWMLCHTAACRTAMQSVPEVETVRAIGPVTFLRRATSPGFVVQGQAHITARCTNRLELEGIVGERLVLRYHWKPGLRSLPATQLRPVTVQAGAPAFIEILSPPPSLVLRMGEGPGVPCEQRGSWAKDLRRLPVS